MDFNIYDTIIIGSGPAGLAAAIYTGRANLKTLIIAGDKWGGQLMLTTNVENFPGFSNGIMGPQLMEELKKQSIKFGAEWVAQKATKFNFSTKPFTVSTDKQEYKTKSVIIAVGAEAQWLDIPGEKKLTGRGISACATCDGVFFKNKKVFVIGGGDAAIEEAVFLTKFASEVTIVHRRDTFRASKVMIQKVANHPLVRTLWDTEVLEFLGQSILNQILFQTKASRWGSEKTVILKSYKGEIVKEGSDFVQWKAPIDGVFIAIGHKPSTQIFQGQIDLDKKGYIVNNLSKIWGQQGVSDLKLETHLSQSKHQQNLKISFPTMTSIPGIFAVGDGFDYRYRQAITAAGTGVMGALDAEKWLTENTQ